MMCRILAQTLASNWAKNFLTTFLLAALLVPAHQHVCLGQGNSNAAPRVMLGVRFSGDSPHVSYVKPNGPAFRAGIEVGDEIFSVNDQFVLQSMDLVRNLDGSRPGDNVRVEVRRNGEYRFFNLVVMMATLDGQRVGLDGSILPPPPEYGMVGEVAPVLNISSWQNLPDNKEQCELNDYLGKVVVLLLFQTTSEFCEEDAMPLMAEFYQRHKDDPEVQFLSVLASFPQHEENTLESGVAMCEKFGMPIPVGQDASQDLENTVCKQLRGLGSPWFVMIDKKGRVALNGMPADIVDPDVINKIKRGERVMESIALSEMVPRDPGNHGNDDH